MLGGHRQLKRQVVAGGSDAVHTIVFRVQVCGVVVLGILNLG